ncbi:hypothetical protein TR51_25685 [Kitasatospora griseola]|uniref:Uncharacterized protein n=1 Tax=Kitasatospora griseola TaxID=2064 RepID=A0A0D0NTD3_KITGR|nr:hypothetical protein [Kitasatospora griseola]KIQ62431.1 hypothetical protein TR51_25685 [Kitasatospora griseola]
MANKTIAAGIAGFALASGLFIVSGQAETAKNTTDSVTAFNDGFADGMQDACEQGSAYACNWLASTTK